MGVIFQLLMAMIQNLIQGMATNCLSPTPATGLQAGATPLPFSPSTPNSNTVAINLYAQVFGDATPSQLQALVSPGTRTVSSHVKATVSADKALAMAKNPNRLQVMKANIRNDRVLLASGHPFTLEQVQQINAAVADYGASLDLPTMQSLYQENGVVN